MIIQTKWDIGNVLSIPSSDREGRIVGISVGNVRGRITTRYLFNDDTIWFTEQELEEENVK